MAAEHSMPRTIWTQTLAVCVVCCLRVLYGNKRSTTTNAATVDAAACFPPPRNERRVRVQMRDLLDPLVSGHTHTHCAVYSAMCS